MTVNVHKMYRVIYQEGTPENFRWLKVQDEFDAGEAAEVAARYRANGIVSVVKFVTVLEQQGLPKKWHDMKLGGDGV